MRRTAARNIRSEISQEKTHTTRVKVSNTFDMYNPVLSPVNVSTMAETKLCKQKIGH